MTITRSRRDAGQPVLAVYRCALAAVLLTGLVAACSGDDGEAFGPSEIGHVHDLVAGEDGLLVATHRGLLRLEDGSYSRVGDEVHDLMAMTRGPGGDIVVSGHPDLRLEQYRVDGSPPVLGLARSSDEGVSWEVVGLLGVADFHAIVPTEAGLLAGDSTGTIWRFDLEGNGQPVGSIPFDINDLAAAPDGTAMVVATSYEGYAATSDDAGKTWEIQSGIPPITEIEWTDEGALGATADGELWAAAGPTGPFERAGTVPDGAIEALLVNDDGAWAATQGGQIYRQENDSWVPLVRSDD